jgi:hypothetical protein
MVITVITVSRPQAASTLLQKRNLVHFFHEEESGRCCLFLAVVMAPFVICNSGTIVSHVSYFVLNLKLKFRCAKQIFYKTRPFSGNLTIASSS